MAWDFALCLVEVAAEPLFEAAGLNRPRLNVLLDKDGCVGVPVRGVKQLGAFRQLENW